jgi:hypothetical protein
LKGDQRLCNLHITDKRPKDQFEKQATYPKGDSIQVKNTGTSQAEKAKLIEKAKLK